MQIYSIFYKKLPYKTKYLLPIVPGKLITFLNPYYIEILKKRSELYENFDYICSDGMLPIMLNRLWGKEKSVRISFDMSSLAKMIFEHLSCTGQGVYFIGSKPELIGKFVKTISQSYPQLNIKGWHHGYVKEQFESEAMKIISSGADIAIIGMGAPLQDEFGLFLRQQGFTGMIYTCGGFFHQTTERINYYPEWINRWNLRTLYRMKHERYVWKRLLKYYPRFIVNYSLFLIKLSHSK